MRENCYNTYNLYGTRNFLVVVGDGTLKVWNTHMPQHPSMSLRAHDAEVLSCDWCKYDQNILATGGSDGLIRGWDLRNITSPVFEQKVRILCSCPAMKEDSRKHDC
jgi:WD40 repeat protein